MRPRDSSRPARLRDQRGLTAIELMVTLAILAILIGIAAPSMTRFIVQWRLSNAVNAVTGSLRIARTEAIARARPVVVCQLRAGTAVECETGGIDRDAVASRAHQAIGQEDKAAGFAQGNLRDARQCVLSQQHFVCRLGIGEVAVAVVVDEDDPAGR